jgi:hypothetical protein
VTGPEASSSRLHNDSSPDVSQRSVGELVGEVAQDLTKLVNQELELAKIEVRAEVKKTGKAAAAFGAASLTLMFALATLFDSYTWAALVVTVLYAIVAAVLFLRAKKTAQTIDPTPHVTVQTLKEDAQWAKTRSS